jgi:hypothetical protein
MNRDIKIDSRQTLVCPETEDIFNEEFWNSLDLVTNALDNMKARFYVDDQCVFFEKPLLESGTMGTGANVDVVVPHMTKSYRDGGQADEGGQIPMCTLRNFPHLIDHCIEWARAQFEDLFVSPAQAAQKFLEGPDAFLDKIRHEVIEKKNLNKVGKTITALTALKKSLEKQAGSPTVDDCVEMAIGVFYGLFRDKILDLIGLFPEDAKTKDGQPFWHGSKKFPTAAEYTPTDPVHFEFVRSAANMFACMLKIHPAKHPSEQNDPEHRWMEEYRTEAYIAEAVAKHPAPEYVSGGVDDLEESDKGATTAEVDTDAQFAQLEALCTELKGLAGSTSADKFEPADFEKDDDDNFHIDFIYACSNMRAANYQIPQAPRHKCKMVAGRIIPAIATTTASVTGLVMFEMYKIVQKKPVEALRNGQFSLGVNNYMMFEADPPKKHENHVDIVNPDPMEHPDAYDEKGNLTDDYKDPSLMLGFATEVKFYPNPQTKYDKVWIDGCRYDMTIQELVDKIDAQFKEAGLTFVSASCPTQRVEVEKTEDNKDGLADSQRQLYNTLMPATKANLERPLAELLKEMTTRSETHATVDDPVDITGRKFYTGIGVDVCDEMSDSVTTPTVVLKFVDFDFTPFTERPEKEVKPWL